MSDMVPTDEMKEVVAAGPVSIEGIEESKGGDQGHVQVLSDKEMYPENYGDTLLYPDATERRTVLETTLSLPNIYRQSEKHTKARRFGRSMETAGMELSDGKDRVMVYDHGAMDSLIKAIKNDDANRIRDLMETNGVGLVLDNLLKVKHLVTLKEQEDFNVIKTDEHHIFMDPIQFAVIQQKSIALEAILTHINLTNQNRNEMVMKNLIQKNVVRINSWNGIGKSLFDFEDIKLEKQNLLHLAADLGPDCLKIILKHLGKYVDISSFSEDKGRNVFHIAASKSSMQNFEILFNSGVEEKNVLKQDVLGNTPLHYAVKFGKLETVFFILTKLKSDKALNIVNHKGKTPLFYAKEPKLVYILLHYGADPCIGRFKDSTLLEHYVLSNPENAKALLNFEIYTSNGEINDRDFLYIYRMRLFLNSNEETEMFSSKEMQVITTFGDNNHAQLLSSPVAELFLHTKWCLIKKLSFLNMFIFFFYIALLTVLVYGTSYFKYHQTFGIIVSPTCNPSEWAPYTQFVGDGYWQAWVIVHSITSVSTLVIFLREVLQLISMKKKYFKSYENILEMATLFSSMLYLIVVVFTGGVLHCDIEQVFGALALFLGWMDMSLLIGKLPSIGLYIFMSVNVLNELLRVFSVYTPIFMAFACAFSVILPKSTIYENLYTSILKVLVMMIGEFDFADNFTWDVIKDQNINIFNVVITQLFFIFTVFLVSIVISNLIIGLTVQNITLLQRKAGYYRLQKTLEQLRDTENILRKMMQKVGKEAELSHYYKEKKRFKSNNVIDKEDIIICVKPQKHSLFSINFKSNLYYKIYTYDQHTMKKGKSLGMEIPDWIVKNTVKAIAEKNAVLEELDADFESFKNSSTAVCYI